MQLKRSERGLYTLIAVTALLVIYVVAFVVSNSGDVKVSFVLFGGRAPLILVMTLCVAVGLLLGIAVARVGTRLRNRTPEIEEPHDDPGPP